MDIIKQYIIQSITTASNNLRLNTQKIEVVALLREVISNSTDIERDIREMKKITELSKLGIRLNEIYNFLTMGQIDFVRLSEKFKEHSQYLIKELSNLTDAVNPQVFKQVLSKLQPPEMDIIISRETPDEDPAINLSQKVPEDALFELKQTEALKEDIIMEEELFDEEAFFQNYESNILKQIKPIDSLLKSLMDNEYDPAEIVRYAEIMETNGELSAKIGFEIIANMHKIISNSLYLIASEELSPLKETIEAVRSCLIVVVAVVKGKEVDITNYLNRAEEFGRQIHELKIKSGIKI
jgi:DNA-binding transcriptional MerR regulator